jgi:hypothetical protein
MALVLFINYRNHGDLRMQHIKKCGIRAMAKGTYCNFPTGVVLSLKISFETVSL